MDVSNLLEVKNTGMTPVAFNAVTSAQWEDLRDGSDTIRFGYFLELEEVGDVAETDTLTSLFDMRGEWQVAVLGDSYGASYVRNDTLRIQLYESGTYKINY